MCPQFRFALEIKQTDKICVGFREAGRARGLVGWGVGPVLYGSVQEWICQDRKGWRKFENFKILYADNLDADGVGGKKLLRQVTRGQMRYVFIGDNGVSEKDLEAAQMIIGELPNALDAVFLHAVSSENQPAPLPDDAECGGVPVVYFRTYAGACAKAFQLGLLNAGSVRKVLDAIEADLASGKHAVDVTPGSLNEQLLLTDIATARSLVGGGGGGSGGGLIGGVASGLGAVVRAPLRLFRGRGKRADDEKPVDKAGGGS